MPLNKQVRGPNNTLRPMPSKPYSFGQTSPNPKGPSLNKAGTRGKEPPKETAAKERAEYDRPDLDYE